MLRVEKKNWKKKWKNGKNKKFWDTSGTPENDYTLLLLSNEQTKNFGAAIYWLQLMMTTSANKFETNNFFLSFVILAMYVTSMLMRFKKTQQKYSFSSWPKGYL